MIVPRFLRPMILFLITSEMPSNKVVTEEARPKETMLHSIAVITRAGPTFLKEEEMLS